MNRIVHFEIPASDPEMAVDFYKSVFGWEINSWGGPMDYWLIKTGENTPGIDGAIYKKSDFMNKTVNTVEVPDVHEYVKKVKAAGGNVLSDVQPIPGVGWFAYCSDIEGVPFGIMRSDENAK